MSEGLPPPSVGARIRPEPWGQLGGGGLTRQGERGDPKWPAAARAKELKVCAGSTEASRRKKSVGVHEEEVNVIRTAWLSCDTRIGATSLFIHEDHLETRPDSTLTLPPTLNPFRTKKWLKNRPGRSVGCVLLVPGEAPAATCRALAHVSCLDQPRGSKGTRRHRVAFRRHLL